MILEKSGFLVMAGTLAAGGVGGFLAHDTKTRGVRPQFAEPPITAVPVTSASSSLVSQGVPSPPALDDNAGTVEACEVIAQSCAGQPHPPSRVDCRQTLAGMSDSGRARMVACMADHCGDRGLLGCEAGMAH